MTTEDRKAGTGPGRVQSHFLDSGAFTLWTKAAKWAEDNGRGSYDFYDEPEFFQYMDDYAAFVKKYQIAIDLYANVDAIPNGELTYRNQKYLEEKHGLKPVPVVHLASGSLEWLKRYIKEGYGIIGLGGLAGKASRSERRRWLDDCFEIVCDTPDRMPKVKIHGFGITAHPLLLRYPWWSVDSVTWAKVGGFGNILMPPMRGGEFVFDKPPYLMSMSLESGKVKEADKHYLTMKKAERLIVEKWLKEIGIPLGKMKGEEVVEFGVLNRHTERRAANLLYFERLRAWLPEWPWVWRIQKRSGFGV